MSFHSKASVVTAADILWPLISGMCCKIIDTIFLVDPRNLLSIPWESFGQCKAQHKLESS